MREVNWKAMGAIDDYLCVSMERLRNLLTSRFAEESFHVERRSSSLGLGFEVSTMRAERIVSFEVSTRGSCSFQINGREPCVRYSHAIIREVPDILDALARMSMDLGAIR